MNFSRIVVSTTLCAVVGACSGDAGRSGSGGECNGAKCDDSDSTVTEPCADILRDLSGTDRSTADILKNGDPMAQLVLGQDGVCQVSVADVASSLLEGGCSNHRSALVSERSQRFDRFTDYRSVTMMECDGNDIFLHYPIVARELGEDGIDAMSEHLDSVNPAVIAQDRETGVFNYYQSTGQDIRFFGSSLDMLQGTDLDEMNKLDGTEASIGASLTVDRNCAACHPGGGLLMKELESPWVHWEPDFDSPDARSIVDAAEDTMGRKSNAIDLESAVIDGNDFVNENRVEFVTEQIRSGDATIGDLLIPVLCSQEFNIGSNFSEGASDFSFSDVVVDSNLSSAFFSVDSEQVYDDLLEERGSTLATQALGVPDGTFRETLGGFTFIHRARIDEDYQNRIEGLVGEDLIADIRAIDFTRSMYSSERCSLKGVLDTVDGKVLDAANPAEALREGIVEALEALDSPSAAERDFLDLVAAPGNDIRGDARTFADACEARAEDDAEALLADYMAYVGQVRKTAADGEQGLQDQNPNFIQFRFPGVMGFSMPIDTEASRPGLRFDPNSCELTSDYVSRGGGGGSTGSDSCVKLAEVVYDVTGSDDGKEWIKLYNSCDDSQSLEGMTLGWGSSGYTDRAELSGSIAAGECIVVGGPVAEANNGDPDIDLPFNFDGDLRNGGQDADGIALFDGGANPLDAVVYGGENTAGLEGPDGEPKSVDVEDVPANSSILRKDENSWVASVSPAPGSCPDF